MAKTHISTETATPKPKREGGSNRGGNYLAHIHTVKVTLARIISVHWQKTTYK